MMNEWYKQLFGESEGKDQKGLMPTSVHLLHRPALHGSVPAGRQPHHVRDRTSMSSTPVEDFFIEELEGNFDGLNFLANQNMSVVNRKAMEGTILAHTDGGVPNSA